MKTARLFGILVPLLALTDSVRCASAPVPKSPASGSRVFSPHPHFRWQREADIQIDEFHDIQIARDEAFHTVVCEDRLEVVSRFVPLRALDVGSYWWRVRRGNDSWSPAIHFEVCAPAKKYTIRAGSDSSEVARVLREAAAQSPARVDFEPGNYTLTPKPGESLVTLTNARDLRINGHGAQLVLGGTFLDLWDCQRVTVEHFTITPDHPGHTLVGVVRKDAKSQSLTVRPQAGYAAGVARFFQFPGTAGSFLGFMDPEHHGKYLVGAFISARNAQMTEAADSAGDFVIHPVKPETLERIPSHGVAVVTAYGWHWAKTSRSEECTFSNLTLSNLPGALCAGAGSNPARSFLSCKVKRLAVQDYFGGHAHCGSGRVGEWIEGCEFECLADDGPAQQSFRVPIRGVEGDDTLLLGGGSLHPGDHVSIVDAGKGRGFSAVVKEVHGTRVKLDRPVSEIATALEHAVAGDWKTVFLYGDSPGNEDFVYRRNSHIGGRAHGVKFNGTRAWITDNHFENLNGNAVLAGYTSEVSGHGARDVVVSGNTIIRCGWTPISVWSTSGLGGNIRIRGNGIREARETAISIRGCTDVHILDNRFASEVPPAQGAWIVAKNTRALRTSGNEHPTEVPLNKAALP